MSRWPTQTHEFQLSPLARASWLPPQQNSGQVPRLAAATGRTEWLSECMGVFFVLG